MQQGGGGFIEEVVCYPKPTIAKLAKKQTLQQQQVQLWKATFPDSRPNKIGKHIIVGSDDADILILCNLAQSSDNKDILSLQKRKEGKRKSITAPNHFFVH